MLFITTRSLKKETYTSSKKRYATDCSIKRCKLLMFSYYQAVDAEGEGIPDLLDIYMKHCSDKSIGPFGGELHPSYDEAWNPPGTGVNRLYAVYY